MTRRSLSLCALSAVVGSAAGCRSKDEPPPPIMAEYDPVPAAEGADFWSPFDAAPSPQADMIYFTALTRDGPAVFAVAAQNGTPRVLHAGEPLVSPFGVMPDTTDSAVFVVDSGSEGLLADDDAETIAGRIFRISTGGGAPESLPAAEGTAPKSLDIVASGGADRIYFTGREPATRQAAVFSTDPRGGSLSTIASGAPLRDPSGIAVASNGTIYVADVSGSDGVYASIYRIRNGSIDTLASGLRVGYPAGIALTLDEQSLFVSGLTREEGTSVVHVIDLASGGIAAFDKNIGQNTESAGVHRAHGVDAFAWANADGSPGRPGGTVYFIPRR